MPAALVRPNAAPPRLRPSPSAQGPPSQLAPPSRASNGSAAAAGKRSPAPAAQAVAGAAAADATAGPPAPPAAWAYQGAPRPPNEEDRLGLLRSLGVLDSEQGPDQFDAITRLLCAVFSVPIALVSLVDAGGPLAASGAGCRQLQTPLVQLGRQLQAWQAAAVSHVPVIWAGLISLLHCPHAERQWFKSVQGLGTCIQTGRNESFCAWTLLPESPCMLVRHTARVSLAAWRCPTPLCWLPNAVVLCAALHNHLRCPLYRLSRMRWRTSGSEITRW